MKQAGHVAERDDRATGLTGRVEERLCAPLTAVATTGTPHDIASATTMATVS